MVDLSVARAGIESLYFDKATIIEYREISNSEDYSTGVEEVIVCEDEPCKISHDYASSNRDDVAADDLILTSILIIRPDLTVKSGSKIVVTRHGVSTVYKNSGEPAMYMNHQQITLELWEDRA